MLQLRYLIFEVLYLGVLLLVDLYEHGSILLKPLQIGLLITYLLLFGR